MPSNLVETRVAEGAKKDRLSGELGIRGADAGGTRVGFITSTYVPEDEISFTVDAPSGQDSALVALRVGLDALRVVEAVSPGKERVQ